jgi:hypothetical protein
MADPTLTDVMNAVEALRNEMRNSFVAERTEREAQTARDRMGIMSRLEDRLTALLRDLGVNWTHTDNVHRKVDNLRDETRSDARLRTEMMTMLRALEGRVAKLERGDG